MPKKLNFPKTASKRMVSFALAFVIVMGASIAAFPTRVEASIAVTIAVKLGKVGIKLADRAVVKGLDIAADKTGNNAFTLAGDMLAKVVGDGGDRKTQQMLQQVLDELKQMQEDMSNMNLELKATISEIGTVATERHLADNRKVISRIQNTCDNIIEKYKTYLDYTSHYAAAVDEYVKLHGKAPEDVKGTELEKPYNDVQGALENFESEAKLKYEDLIQELAGVACRNYPAYTRGSSVYIGGPTQAITNIDDAKAYSADVFAFEHQLYDYLIKEMNMTAYSFSSVAQINRLWAEFLDSEGRLTSAEQQRLEATINKSTQAINDIAGQCDAITRGYMKPYDVDSIVTIDYKSSEDYDVYRKDQYHCKTTLYAKKTSENMRFYTVKPINKPYPYLILQNGSFGPVTDSTLFVKDKAYLVSKDTGKESRLGNEFTTMDRDFLNLSKTKDGNYKLISYNKNTKVSDDYKNFLSNGAYQKSYGNVTTYMTKYGGLDPNRLNKYATTALLGDWNEAPKQYTTLSNCHCHYFVQKGILSYNTSVTNKVTDLKADKHYNDQLLILLKGDKPKYNASLDTSSYISIDLQDYSSSKKYDAGSTLSVKFKSTSDMVNGLGLMSKKAGTILEVLIDPDNYDFLKDADGYVSLECQVPYQDFELKGITPEMADNFYEKLNSVGGNSVNNMQIDSLQEDIAPTDIAPEDIAPEGIRPEDNTPEEITTEEITPEDNTPEISQELAPVQEELTEGLAMNADALIAVQMDTTPLGSLSFETLSAAPAQKSLTDDFQPSTDGTFGVNLNANAQSQEFTDIKGHPLEDDINFVNSWGLLAGDSSKKFSPDSPMTRGMIIMSLAKLTGADVRTYRSSNFSDVPLKSEFRPYAEWAYKNGIAAGHGDWEFKPDEPVTREQMAVFITKFADRAGIQLKTTLGESGPYNDHEDISEWASAAIYAIRPSGIMKDGDDMLFNPKRAVTKAEAASMLAKFIRSIPNTV